MTVCMCVCVCVTTALEEVFVRIATGEYDVNDSAVQAAIEREQKASLAAATLGAAGNITAKQ